jgi:hypothetical protein
MVMMLGGNPANPDGTRKFPRSCRVARGREAMMPAGMDPERDELETIVLHDRRDLVQARKAWDDEASAVPSPPHE